MKRQPVIYALVALVLCGLAPCSRAESPKVGKTQVEPVMVKEIDQRIADLATRIGEQEREAERLEQKLEEGKKDFERNTKRLKELEKEWEALRAALAAHMETAESLRALLKEREKNLGSLLEWQSLKRDVLQAAAGGGSGKGK